MAASRGWAVLLARVSAALAPKDYCEWGRAEVYTMGPVTGSPAPTGGPPTGAFPSQAEPPLPGPGWLGAPRRQVPALAKEQGQLQGEGVGRVSWD